MVKVLALQARDPIWAPVLSWQPHFPFSSLPLTAQDFGTLHPCGRPGRGSWLQIHIASAIALTWGVNHQMEDLPLCLSSLYIRLSNKKNNKNKSLKEMLYILLFVFLLTSYFVIHKFSFFISCTLTEKQDIINVRFRTSQFQA